MSDKNHAFTQTDDMELSSYAAPPNEDWCIKHDGEKMLLAYGDSEYVISVEKQE